MKAQVNIKAWVIIQQNNNNNNNNDDDDDVKRNNSQWWQHEFHLEWLSNSGISNAAQIIGPLVQFYVLYTTIT